MKKLIDKIRAGLLMVDGQMIILFVFSILGSVANYVFQIVLGKYLSISDYGKFNIVNSLSCNLANLYSPLAVYTCRVSAEKQSCLLSNRFIYQRIAIFAAFVSIVIIGLGVLIFLFVPGAGFGVQSFYFWMLTLVMTVIGGGYVTSLGIVQGSGKLGWYGFLGFFLIVVRIGCSFVGIRMGRGVSSVVWAMLGSYVAVIIFIVIIIWMTVKKQYNGVQIQAETAMRYKEMIQLYGMTFLVQMIISLYTNGGEIILMSELYDSEAIGVYSMAAIVAKAGVYVLTIFTAALLPSVSQDWNKGKRIKGKFYFAITVAFGFGLVWFLFLSTIGGRLVRLFFGDRYYEALSGIKYMALWMIGLGMLLIVNTFYLGINRLKGYLMALVIVTACIVILLVCCDISITYAPVVVGVGILLILLFAIVDMKKMN